MDIEYIWIRYQTDKYGPNHLLFFQGTDAEMLLIMSFTILTLPHTVESTKYMLYNYAFSMIKMLTELVS